MKIIILFFLLVGSVLHSTCYEQKGGVEHIVGDLMKYFTEGLTNFTGAEKHQLRLFRDGELGKTAHALVWKGFYSDDERIFNRTVAVKIIWDNRSMNDEMEIIKALNATDNVNIEMYGIPRIYYHGPFLEHYKAIAMTYFDGTLCDRYEREREYGRSFPDLSILSIFKQAIEGLKYLNSMHVVHNDIKPENIFYRREKVFIGDFDLSTINGTQNEGHTPMFASANFYAERDRTSMDDLESLLYAIWYVADVPMARDWEPEQFEGFILSKCNKKEAMARMQAKCEHFKNPYVYEAMKFVCVDQLLSEKKVPDYDRIIAEFGKTIQILERESLSKRTIWMQRSELKHRIY